MILQLSSDPGTQDQNTSISSYAGPYSSISYLLTAHGPLGLSRARNGISGRSLGFCDRFPESLSPEWLRILSIPHEYIVPKIQSQFIV